MNVDLDRIAAAAAPTPVRSTFFSDANANSNDGLDESPAPYQQGPGQPPVQGGTPAPTPPASPVVKPKKQQFQTDQTRPFVLPFSAANAGPKSRPRLVPRSIDEASELYKANMRVSTELWQTWKLREEYMEEESGIASAEALAAVTEKAATAEVNKLGGRLSSLAIDEEAGDGGEENEEEEDEEDKMDPLSMLRRLEKSLRMQELEEQDTKKAKVIAQKRADVQRLERVELMYVGCIVLLLFPRLHHLTPLSLYSDRCCLRCRVQSLSFLNCCWQRSLRIQLPLNNNIKLILVMVRCSPLPA